MLVLQLGKTVVMTGAGIRSSIRTRGQFIFPLTTTPSVAIVGGRMAVRKWLEDDWQRRAGYVKRGIIDAGHSRRRATKTTTTITTITVTTIGTTKARAGSRGKRRMREGIQGRSGALARGT